jgi:predicted DNA-binding protein
MRQLHHRMVRVARGERERLQEQSLRWSLPQQAIVRAGLADVLKTLAKVKTRDQVPGALRKQPSAAKYSTGDARKVLVNTYLPPEQEAQLAAMQKRLGVRPSNLIRVGMGRAVDELEALDPDARSLPRNFQRQILPDSYGGFTTSVRRQLGPSDKTVDEVKVLLHDDEIQRLARVSKRLKLPLAVIARRAINRELDELEALRGVDELPGEYRGAGMRGTQFKVARKKRR